MAKEDPKMLENYKGHVEKYQRTGQRRLVQVHADVTVKPSIESIFDHAEVALYQQLARLSKQAGSPEGLSKDDVKALAMLGDLLSKLSRESRLREESLNNQLNSMSVEELEALSEQLEKE